MNAFDECATGQDSDSFAECIRDAMLYWARPAAYDCVAALCGSAFAVPARADGACVGCPLEQAADARLDFLGHALGFRWERLCPVLPPGSPERDATRRHLQRSLADGALLIHGPIPRWRLSAGLGSGMAHFEAEDVAAPPSCRRPPRQRTYLLHPGEPCLTRCEATRETLRSGAAMATGSWPWPGALYGPAMYDAWIAELDGGDSCLTVNPEGQRCALRAARRIRRSSQSAAHYLERAADSLPGLLAVDRVDPIVAAYRDVAVAFDDVAAVHGEDAPGWTRVSLRCVRSARTRHGEAARRLSHLASLL